MVYVGRYCFDAIGIARTLVAALVACACFVAAVEFGNLVAQGRFVQVGLRLCGEGEPKRYCIDVLDLRTLETLVVRLPERDRGV